MRRALILFPLVLAAGIGTAPPAAGHAALVSSTPEPGATLGTAPGVVVIGFSEPLNVELSNAEIVDPTGARFEGVPATDEKIRVPLSSNVPGIYEVSWSTVSTIDGHTLRGGFRFGVGVSPSEGEREETIKGLGPRDALVALLRIAEYLFLLLAIGMLLVSRLARRDPRLEWVKPRIRLVLWLLFVSGSGVILGEVALASWPPSPASLASYLFAGAPGFARTIRVLAALAAALSVRRFPKLVPVFLGIVVIAMAAAGHAAAVRLGVPVDAVHLVSAGLWAGGILVLATIRAPGGWRRDGKALLDRFSPVAITAFVVTVVSGSLRGVQELNSFSDLLATAYGLVLFAKIIAVLVMLQLSLMAWRRVSGRVRLEAVVAIVVIVAAGFLAAFPLPPGRLADAEAGGARVESESALPSGDGITLGGHAGQVLVGLTIDPARPGPNHARVFVRSLQGDRSDASLPVTLSIDGQSVPLVQCAATCREGTVQIEGGERVKISVLGQIGGVATFRIPALPVAEANDLLDRAQSKMHQLDSYRQEEVLSSGLTRVPSRYLIEAPDRMQVRIPGASTTVFIGDTRYLQRKPNGSWETATIPSLEVPTLIWDSFGPFTDAVVVGAERVQGVKTTVLAFYGTAGEDTPVWLRVWVDRKDRILRSTMFADGHFMTDVYSDFNEPISIDPPV